VHTESHGEENMALRAVRIRTAREAPIILTAPWPSVRSPCFSVLKTLTCLRSFRIQNRHYLTIPHGMWPRCRTIEQTPEVNRLR
jgi:hypothetical protein